MVCMHLIKLDHLPQLLEGLAILPNSDVDILLCLITRSLRSVVAEMAAGRITGQASMAAADFPGAVQAVQSSRAATAARVQARALLSAIQQLT